MKALFKVSLVLFSGLLFSGILSAQAVQSMKLLAPQTGWATLGQGLYWTVDGGTHWKDISPPRALNDILGGVFFLNTSSGYVLLSYPNEKDEPQFRIAHTSDAGASWSSSPIKLPWKRYEDDFFGGGSIFFLDQLHGWVDFNLYSGSSGAPARLLVTKDGGKTWDQTPDDPGRRGSLCFFDENNSVLAEG